MDVPGEYMASNDQWNEQFPEKEQGHTMVDNSEALCNFPASLKRHNQEQVGGIEGTENYAVDTEVAGKMRCWFYSLTRFPRILTLALPMAIS
jgi:hypothetical protein